MVGGGHNICPNGMVVPFPTYLFQQDYVRRDQERLSQTEFVQKKSLAELSCRPTIVSPTLQPGIAFRHEELSSFLFEKLARIYRGLYHGLYLWKACQWCRIDDMSLLMDTTLFRSAVGA